MNIEPKEKSLVSWKLIKDAVNSVINGDRDHGWVGVDSLAAIEFIVGEDAAVSKADSVAKYTLSQDALDAIVFFVNPSACALTLENSWKVINKRTARRTNRKVNPFEMKELA